MSGAKYVVEGKEVSEQQLIVMQLEATIKLLQAVIVQADINDIDVNIHERRLDMSGVSFNYEHSPFDNVVTVKWRRSIALN